MSDPRNKAAAEDLRELVQACYDNKLTVDQMVDEIQASIASVRLQEGKDLRAKLEAEGLLTSITEDYFNMKRRAENAEKELAAMTLVVPDLVMRAETAEKERSTYIALVNEHDHTCGPWLDHADLTARVGYAEEKLVEVTAERDGWENSAHNWAGESRLAEVTKERDDFRRTGQFAQNESRKFFDQSCVNLYRAEAAEHGLADAMAENNALNASRDGNKDRVKELNLALDEALHRLEAAEKRLTQVRDKAFYLADKVVDTEHVIACHTEDLPGYYRSLCRSVGELVDIVLPDAEYAESVPVEEYLKKLEKDQ